MVEAVGSGEKKIPKNKVVRNIEHALNAMGFEVNRDHMGYNAHGTAVESLGGENLAFRVRAKITQEDFKAAGVDRKQVREDILDGNIDLGKRKGFTPQEVALVRSETKPKDMSPEDRKLRENALKRLSRYVNSEVENRVGPDQIQALYDTKFEELKTALTAEHIGFELGEPKAKGVRKQGEEAHDIGLHKREVTSGWRPLVIVSKGQELGAAVDKLVQHTREKHGADKHDRKVQHYSHAHNAITGTQLVSDDRLGELKGQQDKALQRQADALERQIGKLTKRLEVMRGRLGGEVQAAAHVA